MTALAEAKDSLPRALTPADAAALVGGTVIGTGVFLKTAVMARQLGSPTLVLLAWLALWLFFGVKVSMVFVRRGKMPGAERPYKTLGYPLVPVLFILVAAWPVVNTIQTNPVESGIGLALITLGLPFYFGRKQAHTVAAMRPAESAQRISEAEQA